MSLPLVTSARRVLCIVVSLVIAMAGAGFVSLLLPQPARADTSPPAGTPATVSADALPTWQVDGVVWSQVVVGNTVYVTGSFTTARPPGVAVGGAGQVAANNIFAYDIRTGNRVASFSHQLNGQGLGIAASPDGSRIYVGGDFTTVDGTARSHIAAFNVATGALDTSFHPSLGGQVRAIAVSPTTVYVGGNFTSSGGQTRRRLAAFSPSNGALLPWAPSADDNKVAAMVMSPGFDHVIVGGSFTTLNGQPANGMGSLDATTGAVLPWAINSLVQDGGTQCGITSLATDGSQIYGSGFAFGCGNFEGSFAANPNTGAVVWVNDCHGDTYDTYPIGQVLYTVSHAHNCSFIGDFPNSSPTWSINMRHALAFTTYPTGTNTGPDDYGWNYNGVPDSELLQWFPTLSLGGYTGQNQAAWSVAGNSNYVALGGEFPSVNGTAQQGLVRFAVSSIAPNKRGPAKASGAPAPSAISLSAGTARVAWQAPYDMDNKTLTYNVYRSGTAAPVYTTTADSTYWDYPMMGVVDSGLKPGSTYTYTVKVNDPFGNTLNLGASNAVTIGTNQPSQYARDVLNDGAIDYWRLDESGSTSYDQAGFNDATAQGGVTRGLPGAINGDADTASGFDGSTGQVSANSIQAAPASFSIESWINTSTNAGGKIVGYGNTNTGDSSSYDRHVYMDNAGHVIFGVYNNGFYTIASPKTYNDGTWHHIVATLDASSGMALYIDGKRIGLNGGTRTAQQYDGYWRIGGDNLNGWPSQPSSESFNGRIDDVAIYPSALSLDAVRRHYVDSGRTVDVPAPPTDKYGAAVFNSGPGLYWRLGERSGSTATDASGNEMDGVYSGPVTLNQPGAIAGTSDTAAAFDGVSATVGSASPMQGPSVYSEELWFRTTTTHGGKLIGFGDQQSGFSGNYDRHVYMENSGQLTFGVWTGTTNTITSPGSYNDGSWHYMVATQGSDGMKLYVDGQLVGTNPQTDQQPYTGYWRVGGDSDWGGDSPFFNGTIDEVAVYFSELSATDVRAHYLAAGGNVPNQPPVAAFTQTEDGLNASFDGSGSADPDGAVASYAWDFGDGTTDTGMTAQHTYAAAGDYQVALTVTDDRGGTNTTTATVHVDNTPPVADFTASSDRLAVAVDASASSDADGAVASYSWDWGDGSPVGAGRTATHTYGAAGDYTVTLTVTDNAGATDTKQATVHVTSNASPTASFTDTANNLDVAVDGSASSDVDGSVASYSWDWGDGSPAGSGRTATHAYAAAGDYVVTLTVTDNDGATDSSRQTVTVSAAPTPNLLASDDFGRTTTGGWGSADVGGPWTVTGNRANFVVAGGTGTVTDPNPGSGPSITLSNVSAVSSDVTVVVTPQQVPNGAGSYVSLTGRQVPTVGAYRAVVNFKPNGQLALTLVRLDGAGQATIAGPVAVAGLTYAAGDALHVRMTVIGTSPTMLGAKVWADGQSEPAGWQISGSDASASMQTAGSVGLVSYLSASATNAPFVAAFQHFRAYDSGAAPAVARLAVPHIVTAQHRSVSPTVTTRTSPDFGTGSVRTGTTTTARSQHGKQVRKAGNRVRRSQGARRQHDRGDR